MVVVERGCDRSDIFCLSASVNVNPNKAALLLGRVVLVPAAPSCPAPPLFMLFDCDYERGAEKLHGRTLPCYEGAACIRSSDRHFASASDLLALTVALARILALKH